MENNPTKFINLLSLKAICDLNKIKHVMLYTNFGYVFGELYLSIKPYKDNMYDVYKNLREGLLSVNNLSDLTSNDGVATICIKNAYIKSNNQKFTTMEIIIHVDSISAYFPLHEETYQNLIDEEFAF